jgi:hypothetical protein
MHASLHFGWNARQTCNVHLHDMAWHGMVHGVMQRATACQEGCIVADGGFSTHRVESSRVERRNRGTEGGPSHWEGCFFMQALADDTAAKNWAIYLCECVFIFWFLPLG